MLRPDAAVMRIAPVATLDVAALRTLATLARTTSCGSGAQSGESRGSIPPAPESAKGGPVGAAKLAILLEREDAPAISLKPEQRRRLRDLMVEALIAVHRAGGAGKEGSDDGARE